MSVTGVALILFLTFHMSMNVVALFSGEAYNMICELLGSNWYAVAATIALAGLAVLHIGYAFWLTIQNKRARGTNKYAVEGKLDNVDWASKNMLALGIVVLGGLLIHLYNFWWKMMAAELFMGATAYDNPSPTNGYYFIQETFSQPVYVVLYLVWLAALWFHLSHGFWSAMQTLGWNGKTWFCRWKLIGLIYTTVLMAGFAVVVLYFAICHGCC